MAGLSPTETATFVSFDGGVVERAAYRRPDRYRAIEADVGPTPRIARGGGYSYAPASFGAGATVLDMTRFDRLLRFEPAERLLEVEAGVTLGDLFGFTAPRGLWLPVQPGYPAITVGGCIAANVHGKNPAREGTFERSVEDLTLFHPRHGTLRVDRSKTPELFELTCGGYGLTGVILSATLRLDPLPGPDVTIRRTPVSGLADGLARARTLTDARAFAYTWHDGAPAPGRFGRGFVFEGTIAPGPAPPQPVPAYRRVTPAGRGRLPVSVWGRWTGQLLSGAFYALERRRRDQVVPLFDAIFPFARRGEYFTLFGRRGLAEYQVLVPEAAADGFIAELERRALARRPPILMMSLKLFRGRQRLLRFEGDGVCVTLDLVRSAGGLAFMTVLDELTVAAGALPHLIKDSRLPLAVVQRCYPDYARFREERRAHDPTRIFRSAVSAALDL